MLERQKPGSAYIIKKILTAPHIIQDSIELVKHFYGNTASTSSKLLGITLKQITDVFILYENSLAKDTNPTTGNVIREGVNLIPNAINAASSEPHTENSHEVQDFTHFSGQTIRLACKISFQVVSNITKSDSVKLSRASNIFCDSPGVMGQVLSKASQPESGNSGIYYFWPDQNLGDNNIYGIDYLKEKLTKEFISNSILTAVFKAGALDQVGGLIKLVSKLPLVSNAHYAVEETKNSIIAYIFNVPPALLNAQYNNIYSQMDAVLEHTNSSSKGYVINSILGGYKMASRGLMDLYVTGPVLLSYSVDSVKYFSKLEPLSLQAGLSLGTVFAASYYQDIIASHVNNIIPELVALFGTMVISDSFYDAFVDSSPAIKLVSAAGALTYSHYKEDIWSYFPLSNVHLAGEDVIPSLLTE